MAGGGGRRRAAPGHSARPAPHSGCRAQRGGRGPRGRRSWSTAATPLPTTCRAPGLSASGSPRLRAQPPVFLPLSPLGEPGKSRAHLSPPHTQHLGCPGKAGRGGGNHPQGLGREALPCSLCSAGVPRRGGSGGPAHRAGQGSSLHFCCLSSGRLRGSQCLSSTGPACRSVQCTLCLCTPGGHGGSASAWHRGCPPPELPCTPTQAHTHSASHSQSKSSWPSPLALEGEQSVQAQGTVASPLVSELGGLGQLPGPL